MGSVSGWHIALQEQFCQQYVQYLQQHLKFRVIAVEKQDENERWAFEIKYFGSLHRSQYARIFLLYSGDISPIDRYRGNVLPEVWLQRSSSIGIVLMHLFLTEPYFALEIYACDRSLILSSATVSSQVRSHVFLYFVSLNCGLAIAFWFLFYRK